MSVVVARWVKDGRLIPIDPTSKDILALIGDADKHQSRSTPLRTLITNIYQTKDGRFYHTHGKPHTIAESLAACDAHSNAPQEI